MSLGVLIPSCDLEFPRGILCCSSFVFALFMFVCSVFFIFSFFFFSVFVR